MPTKSAQILGIASSLVKQYGNTSFIKIPFLELGLSKSFLSTLSSGLLNVADTAVCRIDINMDRFTKRGRSDVSKNIIYSPSGGSKYISDNIVPTPWEMTLEANVPYDLDVGGILSLFSNLSGVNTVSSRAMMLKIRKKVVRTLLEKAYERGVAVSFKDDSNTVYEKCAIQSLEFMPEPSSENHLRIRMTLVDMRVLSNPSDDALWKALDKTPIGTIIGDSIDIGTSIINAVSDIGLGSAVGGMIRRFG